MFKREHHQRIAKVLEALNPATLGQAECYFAGGTAIVLALNEYRESVDIDFLCASQEGYRALRNAVSSETLGAIFHNPIKCLREVKRDRYGIRTILEVDGVPIKFEIVNEGRIGLAGSPDPTFGIPTLCKTDMYAEKLLANADRGGDASVMSRDIIDLSMMVNAWGPIPNEAWSKVNKAYGQQALIAYHSAVRRIQDKDHLRKCLHGMHMDQDFAPRILAELAEPSNQPPGRGLSL
jgi:hypothetical protein